MAKHSKSKKKRDKNQEGKSWLKLDNAGKLYPSIVSSRVSTAFRLTAVMKEPVNPDWLQVALDKTWRIFPFFNVKLRKGAFWYYFKKTNQVPQVEKEFFYPCHSIDMHGSDGRPFKVLYYQNRIHLEVSHAISDGAGGVEFLKALIEHYEAVKTKKTVKILVDQNVVEEDAFMSYYEPKIPVPTRPPKAYHFPFQLIEKGQYRITSGTYDSQAFKALSKRYHTSPTKMLLGLYFETIQEFMMDHPPDKMRPIVLNLPVNLRNLFPSKTMRNFFISLTPIIDTRLGYYSREEIIKILDYYFGMTIREKYLKQYISRNIRNELFLHIRLIPLFIKNIAMPIIYNTFGESLYTSSISNIGNVVIDAPYGDSIERLEVLPPPSEGNIIKATVIGYRNQTTISFGSLTDDTAIERTFFRKLRQEGIDVHIESNYHIDEKGEANALL